ncbi:MAG: sigma-70 family RNA polymerase sigma factor [Phycisphaerae bacterium]|nr:sigma-70 family RNA polymerase sigma factor [Phycisphaerae bacterium]
MAALLQRATPELRSQIRIDRKWRHLLEPEDVLQVTFSEAFLALPKLRSKAEPEVLGWLRTIARNNLHDAVKALSAQRRTDGRRRLQPAPTTDETDFFDQLRRVTTTPSREVAELEARAALKAAIAQLPSIYATVIQRTLAECPIESIAHELGRSPGAIHMLRARACDWLREALRHHPAFFS